jgi:hypothetical protein
MERIKEMQNKDLWSPEEVLKNDNLRYLISGLVEDTRSMNIPIEHVLQAIENTFYSTEDTILSPRKEDFKDKVKIFRKKYEYELVEVARNSRISLLGKPEEYYVDGYCKVFEAFYEIYRNEVYGSYDLIKKYGARLGVDDIMLESKSINEMLKGMETLLKEILGSEMEFYGRIGFKAFYYNKFRNYRRIPMVIMCLIWVIINEK